MTTKETLLNSLSLYADLTYEKQKEIHERAKRLIDSEWHYSWHWELNSCLGLTDKGWETALKDGISLRDGLQKHVDALNKLIPQLDDIVTRNKLRKELDDLYEIQDSITDTSST